MKTKKNTFRFIGLALVVLILFSCVYIFTFHEERSESNSTVEDDSKEIKISAGIDTAILNNQQELEKNIFEDSAGSTFDQPYIQLDPFGNAPLTALIIFDTEEPSKVQFTVKGSTSDVDISDTTDQFTTHHELAVLGLYPDAENTVEIVAISESGNEKRKTVMIQTEPLPDYIPSVIIEKLDKEQMEIVDNGLTFAVTSTKYTIGFDINGDIRWYSSRYNSHVFKPLENGHLLYLSKDQNSGSAYNRLLEMDFIGKIYNAYYLSDNAEVNEKGNSEKTIVHHDAIELPSGNLLLTVNDGNGTYIEDTIIEIDRETGTIIKVIDLKNLLPSSFYEEYDSTERDDGLIDWFHNNSFIYDTRDNSLIISGRNQDTIFKIDYSTEEIKWILSDSEGWPEEYETYLVKGVGDNFKYTGGQHAPIIIPEEEADQNADTIDILVFDNNIAITRGDEELSETFSAGSQYRINEKTKTAELIWTYGKERGKDLFSLIIGSNRYMFQTGNRLINFGYTNDGTESHIIEVDNNQPANVVFEAIISDFPEGSWIYRAERMSLYPDAWEFALSTK
ncbi:aryl-sulfate sulfotransferase [Fervidibacillus albus]|uniref:Aryl-sulfate sulfotransferase n=1 Tax=Fervidibacillus albus TaxID=2980026 RepID=A0A9E8RVE4_9BACI|nr:aryl-sulfate sulfotransferase [Fervidibacillus albus]WAA09209.1 aryl-sulfate sulfotransferase [Fervidibacillus albus]